MPREHLLPDRFPPQPSALWAESHGFLCRCRCPREALFPTTDRTICFPHLPPSPRLQPPPRGSQEGHPDGPQTASPGQDAEAPCWGPHLLFSGPVVWLPRTPGHSLSQGLQAEDMVPLYPTTCKLPYSGAMRAAFITAGPGLAQGLTRTRRLGHIPGMDRQVWKGGRIDGWTEEWMAGWTDGWLGASTDGQVGDKVEHTSRETGSMGQGFYRKLL